jgi:hypothetical protein
LKLFYCFKVYIFRHSNMPRLRQYAIEDDTGDVPLTSPAPELSSREKDELNRLFHYFGLDNDTDTSPETIGENVATPPETIAAPADSAPEPLPELGPNTPKRLRRAEVPDNSDSAPHSITSPSPVEFETKVPEFEDEQCLV